MKVENNRQWVWLSDEYSHLPLPENQFIMSLQTSRKEVCRKEPNRQPWWWGTNLDSWHEQFQTQNAQITKALTVCLNCADCFLIGEVSLYLLATSHGTFLGRLIDSFVLSGLLKGRVSWSVDGGDDLQLGWLQTLLQWPGGELIGQMAATSATSASFALKTHPKQTQHPQILLLLSIIFSLWIVSSVFFLCWRWLLSGCKL